MFKLFMLRTVLAMNLIAVNGGSTTVGSSISDLVSKSNDITKGIITYVECMQTLEDAASSVIGISIR